MSLPRTKKVKKTVSDFEQIRLKTQITIVRNLVGHAFTGELSETDANSFSTALTKRLLALEPALQDITNDFLLEDNVIDVYYEVQVRALRRASYRLLSMCTPAGDRLCIEINCANHLTFSCLFKEGDGRRQLQALQTLIAKVEAHFRIAYDDRYGYLTAQAAMVGTGMRVRSWLHLPAICFLDLIQETTRAAEYFGEDLVFTDQDNDAPPGHILILFNHAANATNMETCVTRHMASIQRITTREIEAEQKLYYSAPFVLLNKALQTQHLLEDSVMFSEEEVLDFLSSLRMCERLNIFSLPRVKFTEWHKVWFERFLTMQLFMYDYPRLTLEYEMLPESVAQKPETLIDTLRARLVQRNFPIRLSPSFIRYATK